MVSSIKQLWVQSDSVRKVQVTEDDETLLLKFDEI
jgi:hypothetical protein